MTENKCPRIHLTMDNCFAIKRWVRPSEWARIIRELGDITCVQSSTDMEIDPQFCPPEYTDRWVDEVERSEKKYGLRLVSFYSGYVTYRSTSLLNWDKSYRERFRDSYLYGTIDLAKRMNAAAGGALQAFADNVLQSPENFAKADAMLMDYSVQCAKYAGEKGVFYGFEQMYTPTQGWWRIKDVKKYMRDTYKIAGNPLYTTIDTAHIAGQSSFYYPTDNQFDSMIKNRSAKGFHLPDEMKRMVENGTSLLDLKRAAARYEYWFSERGDEDLFEWLKEVACYSPIMHLQQTDGSYSSHRPFTKKFNEKGIVKPRDVLQAIVKCYDKPVDKDMPPRAKDIYLAYEIFFGVTDSNEDILSALRETIAYWRDVIREDGKPADYWL